MKELNANIHFRVPDDYDINEAKELIYFMISDCAWDNIYEMGYKVLEFSITECGKKTGFLFFNEEEDE